MSFISRGWGSWITQVRSVLVSNMGSRVGRDQIGAKDDKMNVVPHGNSV